MSMHICVLGYSREVQTSKCFQKTTENWIGCKNQKQIRIQSQPSAKLTNVVIQS